MVSKLSDRISVIAVIRALSCWQSSAIARLYKEAARASLRVDGVRATAPVAIANRWTSRDRMRSNQSFED
jgi:hypothetical protein